ncbi:MAG: outer membrane lipoprotein-sorting protein [Polyangiaceae bacterium]
MRVVFVTSPALALLIAGSASADPPAPPPAAPMAAPAPTPQLSPTEILERMEGTNNMADQTLNMRLTVVEVNGTRRAYEFTFQQKGTKRLVEFTSGESKGMSVLVEDRDTVYVYLPGFRKVRRVATSAMSQPMVGSDLSSEDMATASWTQSYDASLAKEDDTSWWLSLVPKPGVTTSYAKIVHRVDKAHFLQTETHYFNASGQEVKSFVGSDPTNYGGVLRYRLLVFSDPRTGHRSELETTSAKYNQGLSDDLFTVRQLQWGK